MLTHSPLNLSLILIFGSLISGLSGCHSTQVAKTEPSCPSSPETPPTLSLTYEGDIYKSLQSVNIKETPDTLIFQSERLNFIYCRSQNNWIITEGTYPKVDMLAQQEEFANPTYQSLEFKGKTYKYRVILDPNPFPDFRVEPQQVIFELIHPDQSNPQSHVLYTLDQVKAKTGFQLGVPQVRATEIAHNQIYWAIASEQGEGFSGIATIIRYHPDQDQLTLLQPKGLESQQIKDIIVTGNPQTPILWLATQQAGEGNPFLPGSGLVAYSTNNETYQAYHIRNSPLVGVIPHRLWLDGDFLWVSTGNGICNLPWQTPDQFTQWNCWQFELKATVPPAGVTLYPSSVSWDILETLPSETGDVTVLWWTLNDFHKKKGRYEVVYAQGIEVTLPDQGSIAWQDYYRDSRQGQPWQSSIYWVGRHWIWQGEQFIRPLDGVSLNLVGGGALGIEQWNQEVSRSERYAIRGNLDLLNLTDTSTQVKHYSAWVEDQNLTPYVTLIPYSHLPSPNNNPLNEK